MEAFDGGEEFEQLMAAMNETQEPNEREEIRQCLLRLAFEVGERAAKTHNKKLGR